MKLYTFPQAPNARKANAVIQHLGIKDIEIEITNIAEGAHRKPEFLAINPMGKVPCLVDGDLKLWESNAICQYLCELRGDTGLYPRDLRVRADISRWMFWEAAHWQPATGILTFEHFVKPFFRMGEPDAARVKDGEERFHIVARVLDHHLEGRRFLVGDAVTLADFIVGAMLTYAGPARIPVADYHQIQAWNARLDAIPAWKSTAPQPRG